MEEETLVKPKKSLIMRFIPYYKPYLHVLIFDLFCASLTTVCDLVLPLIVKEITNTATTDMALLTPQLVWRVGIIYMLLRVVDTAANYYMVKVGHVMGTRIETDMRRDIFAHLQKLSFTYFSNTKVGQIMSRITRDLFEVTEFAHHCPEEFFIGVLKMVVSFIILANVDVWLTLIIFAMLPLMIWLTLRYRIKLSDAFSRERHQVGELNAQVEDSLLGIRVVKSFANEEIEEEKFARGNEGFLEIKKEVYNYLALFHSGIRMFDGLMYVVVLVAGSFSMMYGRITAGDFIAYLLYATTLLATVRRIAEFGEQFMQGMTGIQRFFEIMDEPVEIADSEDAQPIGDVKGEIDFDHVTFRYADGNENVLSNVELHVASGDNVALVGPSGGGKTTLASLIPRFYDVTGGRILLDGRDVRDITLSSLRGSIGVVQQEVYLFSGTIAENIGYGRPGATREEIVEAAKLAGADEFISAFPDGYDTYTGERGVKLSGGQKQRVSIARVFLKNPPILILDEATSALDNESEHVVQQSLELLSKGRTTFTIAHRLSTIRHAKVILVLTENGIVEQGTHEELIAKKGVYYRLYEMSAGDKLVQN
mgnify:CR=1 FL=1